MTAFWELEGNVENTSCRWVFSLFECSEISGVFYQCNTCTWHTCKLLHFLSILEVPVMWRKTIIKNMFSAMIKDGFYQSECTQSHVYYNVHDCLIKFSFNHFIHQSFIHSRILTLVWQLMINANPLSLQWLESKEDCMGLILWHFSHLENSLHSIISSFFMVEQSYFNVEMQQYSKMLYFSGGINWFKIQNYD